MLPEVTTKVVSVVEDRATVDLFLVTVFGPVWLNRVDVRLPAGYGDE